MTKRLFLLLGVTIFLIGCTQKTSQENSGVPTPESLSMPAASTSDTTQKLPPDTMAKAEKALSQESQDIEPTDEGSAVQITSSLTDSPFTPPAVTGIQTALKNVNLYEGKKKIVITYSNELAYKNRVRVLKAI